MENEVPGVFLGPLSLKITIWSFVLMNSMSRDIMIIFFYSWNKIESNIELPWLTILLLIPDTLIKYVYNLFFCFPPLFLIHTRNKGLSVFQCWYMSYFVIDWHKCVSNMLDYCINMSRHSLIGRKAAVLEAMALANWMYVLAKYVRNWRWIPPQWVIFLNLCELILLKIA